MEIPDYQTLMLPFLKFLADGKEYHIREVIEHLSQVYHLTEKQRNELLPSGRQPIIDNRVGWARTYLKKAGLLDSVRRGYFKITERGLEVLHKNTKKIDVKFLEQFPEFVEFRTIKKEQDDKKVDMIDENQTPDELMSKGHELINANLAQELLTKLKEEHFSVLETIVLRLLSNMGYGEVR